MFKRGDIVAYRTKDWHGYQYIFAEVTHDQALTLNTEANVCLKTIPNDVGLLIPAHVLTKVKTVWQDTMKLVSDKREMYIRKTNHETPKWYAVVRGGEIGDKIYYGLDGNLYDKMNDGNGAYFKSKGALIDHFLGIGIDVVELRD
jgi:hypothetical protein